MNAWWFIMFIWLVGSLLAQAAEVGTGFTSGQLAWPLLEGETQAAVTAGDWPPAGGRVYIGSEAIDYGGVADACPGLPTLEALRCLTDLERGQVGTAAGSYAAGSLVRGSESQALSSLSELRLVQTDTGWGVIAWPVQSFRALARIVGEMGTWDYAYLDGQGQWLAIFLQLANLAMLISLIRLFAGPLSSLAGGVARGLTGGRLG